jgi:hypothetical protein
LKRAGHGYDSRAPAGARTEGIDIVLPLLSAPLRRWLLITLLVPAIAFVLSKLGQFLERRHDGQSTKVSRTLLSSSAFLRRRAGKRTDAEALPEGVEQAK